MGPPGEVSSGELHMAGPRLLNSDRHGNGSASAGVAMETSDGRPHAAPPGTGLGVHGTRDGGRRGVADSLCWACSRADVSLTKGPFLEGLAVLLAAPSPFSRTLNKRVCLCQRF